MKQFTIDEFIHYNNPCFNCGRETQFKIGVDRRDKDKIFIYPIVGSEWVSFFLNDFYNLYFEVERKTNKIEISNKNDFLNYSKDNGLFLISSCRCGTEISTYRLQINWLENKIQPIEWHREELTIDNNDKYYWLTTSAFGKNKETIIICPYNFNIKLPFLFPLYKFKNKQTFLNKIEMLKTFR